MPLTLVIENRASLPDGGPLDITVSGRKGIDIGRAQHLDWSLPDPARVISSKHCEIRYRDGAYWLIDVSINGTFVNGSAYRVQGPHLLRNGDKLEIGHYIIGVVVVEEQEAPSAPAPDYREPPRPSDPWSSFGSGEGGYGIDLPSRPAAAPASFPGGDALDWAADLPMPEAPDPAPAPAPDWLVPLRRAQPAASAEPAGGPAEAGPPPALTPPQPAASAPPQPAEPHSARAEIGGLPPALGMTSIFPLPGLAPVEAQAAPRRVDFGGAIGDLSTPPKPSFDKAAAASAEETLEIAARRATESGAAAPSGIEPSTRIGQGSMGGERFVELLARGAGVPVDVFAQQKPEIVAEMIGALLKITIDDLRALLAARAETKGLVRSTNQTTIQAFENNPLKFSPSTEDALRRMFELGNRSYLRGEEAIRESFRDLKTHQVNTYGAMQQGLKMLIDDFSPETIERATEKEGGLGGVIGNRKAKLWEAFVLKWQAKAARHDNGLLDVFMMYFSECYDRLTHKAK